MQTMYMVVKIKNRILNFATKFYIILNRRNYNFSIIAPQRYKFSVILQK